MLFTCTLDMALDLAYDYMSVGSIVYAGQDEVENADWYPMLDGYEALKLDARAGRAEVEANAEAMV